MINPVFEIAVRDATLADVGWQLAVGLAICLALVPLIALLGRRIQLQLAAD